MTFGVRSSRAPHACAAARRPGRTSRTQQPLPTHAHLTASRCRPPSLGAAAALATLLPLLGVGRRLAYSQLVQLCVLSQAACYALVVCAGSYQLLPAAYIAVG